MSQNSTMKILNSILNVRKTQPGALLISGPWGTGKTFFWNNSIVPELSRLRRDHLYISLGSIETPSDFFKKLAFSFIKLRLSKTYTGKWYLRIAEVLKFLFNILKSTLINLPFKLNLGDVSLSYEGAVKLTWGLLDYKETIPSDCIICIDDFERSQLKENDLMTICLALQDIKQATIILICNEERLNEGIFKVNKEKLVWKTYTFIPDSDLVFNFFTEHYSLAKNREKIKNFKENILIPFNKSGRNLRILARCIKDIDEILTIGGESVTSEHIRFFCSLYTWYLIKGGLEDIEAYKAETAYLTGRNLLKADAGEKVDLSKIELESTVFHKQFYTSTLHNGFSEALYYLIKDGTLQEDLFLKEIIPSLLSPTMKLLKEINESHWYYFKESKLRNYIDQIEKTLITDNLAQFHTSLALAIRALDICELIELDFPDNINKSLESLIAKRAPFADDSEEIRFNHESPKALEFIKPWLKEYNDAVITLKAIALEKEVISNLESGETINTKILERNYNDREALKKMLISKNILDKVHSIREDYPESYYLFFTRALTNLQGTPDSIIYVAAKVYKEVVDRWTPIDNAGKNRKKSLQKVINKILESEIQN